MTSVESPAIEGAPAERRFRPELQGLRALACALVVAYHIWLGRVSGGVDVFFLISGFLITGQLVRAAARGRVAFRPLWGRMITRLFPAALTVLTVVVVASTVALPQSRWFATIREVAASALYVENWRLAADSANYFAQHNTASVVQHFWSLSIQGQFYVVWPLLVALVALLARKTGHHRWAALVVVFGVLFAGSLGFSIWLTAVDQPLAYFHSLARVWEFALGGLLALVIDKVRVPAAVRVALGWLGVTGLVSCGLVLRVGTVFPGWLALWPTLAATLVIIAGATGSRVGVDRLLTTRPVRYLGDLSYALYLWHWPVLVFYLLLRDREQVGLAGGMVIIGVSLCLSVLTHHGVEQPVRDSALGVRTPWGAYRFGAISLVLLLVTVSGWHAVSLGKARQYAISVGDPDHPGAQARTPGFEYWGATDAPLVPSFVALPREWAEISKDRCRTSPRNRELEICATETTGVPERRIVVAGDSHAEQFLAALLPVAAQRNWQITSMVLGGCPFSTDSDTVPGSKSCLDWNAAVADEILAERPDAVFTIGTRDVRPGVVERTPPGYVAQWRKIDQAHIPVIAVRDNPRFDFAPSECVAAHGADDARCGTPRAELYATDPPYSSLDDVPPNVSFLDFSDYFCTGEVCPPVIGNVLLYLDDNHITATYMSTMSAIVEHAIDTALDERAASQPA